MKSYVLFLICLALVGEHLLAQEIEQISTEANYSQMTFYRLSDGATESIPLNSWDIAFSNTGRGDAGLVLNEGASLSGSALKLYLAPQVDWPDPITHTDQFTEENQLYNPDISFAVGAFNSVADTTNGLDFGWGLYNPQNHKVIGNRVFVIQLRDGSYRKILIEELSAGTYQFKIARLDGSDEQQYSVSKNDSDDPLIFFSIEEGRKLDIEIDYDLIFTRYSEYLDDGSGNLIPYMVSGILQAPGVRVAEATGVNPFTVKESDFAEAYQEETNTIGYDWKYYDFTQGWVLTDDLAYFIESAGGAKYKCIFLDFEGSSTGITTIEKTLLETSSNIQVQAQDLIKIYPNPATERIFMEGLNPFENVELLWMSTTGKILYRQLGNPQHGFDVPTQLIQGSYILHVRTVDQQFARIINLK